MPERVLILDRPMIIEVTPPEEYTTIGREPIKDMLFKHAGTILGSHVDPKRRIPSLRRSI